MKKKSFIMFAMCIAALLCLFATQVYATESKEYSKGSLNYIVLDDNTLKITKYHGEEKNYTIPSKIGGKTVSVIGRFAFLDADKLENLVIPGSVKVIEDEGIASCAKLKTIVINKGKLKNMSNLGIVSCHKLQSLRIPKNVKNIGTMYGCEKLKEIIIDAGNPYMCSIDGVVFSKDKKILLRYPQGKLIDEYVIPSSVEIVASWSFYDVGPLKVFIPKSVEKLEEEALACSRVEVYTDATKAPKKWKKALNNRTVRYKQKSKTANITLKKVSKLSCTQTTNTITLEWNRVDAADGYIVYKYNSKTKRYEKFKNTTDTTLKISKLKAGTVYKFKVIAFTKVNEKTIWGKYSDVLETATKTKTPVLSKLSAGSKQFTATWKSVSGATGYQVLYSTSSKFTSDTIKKVTIKGAKATKATVKKLKKSKKYYVKVRAYKSVNGKKIYSSYSSVKNLKTK